MWKVTGLVVHGAMNKVSRLEHVIMGRLTAIGSGQRSQSGEKSEGRMSDGLSSYAVCRKSQKQRAGLESQQSLAHQFEVGSPCLNLLGNRMNIAESPRKRLVCQDRRRTGFVE
jgi:hypothetical protein